EIAVDGGDQVRDALERSAANTVAGNFTEPALDQVEPGAAGGNEMEMHARMTTKPALHRRTLVRTQIVEHDVNGLLVGRGRVDAIEKPDEFLRVALRAAGAEDGAIQDAQGGVQTGRAVADVVVGLAFRYLPDKRQHRPRAIQCLNAALFVDAEDHGFVRRIEIQADDVAELVDKPRVFRQLEPRHPMRLQPMLMPDA